MKKAVGSSWFDTEKAQSWTTSFPERTIWRTETGAWVLEVHNDVDTYSIERVDGAKARAVITECGEDVPPELLEDADRI